VLTGKVSSHGVRRVYPGAGNDSQNRFEPLVMLDVDGDQPLLTAQEYDDMLDELLEERLQEERRLREEAQEAPRPRLEGNEPLRRTRTYRGGKKKKKGGKGQQPPPKKFPSLKQMAEIIREAGKIAAPIAKSRGGRKAIKRGVQAVGIHPEAEKIILSWVDGANRGRPVVGLPTFPNQPSSVVRVQQELVVTTGTNGVGFLALNPSFANDGVAFSYSTAAYAGTTLPAMNAGATGQTTGTFSNLPYATAAFGGTALTGRIVKLGVHWSSSTAPLYRQGIFQQLVDMNHNTIGGYTVAQFGARKETKVNKLNDKDHEFTMIPSLVTDQNYTATPSAWNSSAAAVIGGILFSGATTGGSNPVTILVNLTLDVEYIGTTCESATKPKPIVPMGTYETALQAAHHAHTHRVHNQHKTMAQIIDFAKSAYHVACSPTGKAIISGVATGLML
jgi:hypothetical protein